MNLGSCPKGLQTPPVPDKDRARFEWWYLAEALSTTLSAPNPSPQIRTKPDEVADEPRYRFVAHLGARIGRLNPSWQAPEGRGIVGFKFRGFDSGYGV